MDMELKKLLDIYWKEYMIGHLYLSPKKEYVFKYDKDGVEVAKNNGFDYLIGFSDLDKEYVSRSLFPVFKSRIPPRNRHNINEILNELKIDTYDEIELLRKTRGKSFSDDLETR